MSGGSARAVEAGEGRAAGALSSLGEGGGSAGGAPGGSSGLPSAQRFARRRVHEEIADGVEPRSSCCEMVTCISLDGRLFSLKMAMSGAAAGQ